MKRFVVLACLLVLPGSAWAVEARLGGFGNYGDERTPCLTDEERSQIRARLRASQEELAARGALLHGAEPQVVAFGWPLRLRSGADQAYGYHGISNFVDQDPAIGSVLDYQCGNRSYDQASGYNHSGTDFFSWPFGWYKMDHDDVEIVAAAPGQILFKSDGNFDRNCGFGSGNWNAVYVQHADGSQAWYGHMKSGSLTPKGVGEMVSEGEYLGVVGSSGNSSGPHLHFEVYDTDGKLIDPYAGPCNSLNAESWWAAQRPYYDSAINALITHTAPPDFPSCPGTETINASDTFVPGTNAYFAAYYRDQLFGQVGDYSVRDADGALVSSWSHSSPAPYYAASYWYWYFTLPSGFALGQWRFQVDYEGESYVHDFFVVDPTAVEGATPLGRLDLTQLGSNPAVGPVELEYHLPKSGPARLVVFDAQGRRVARLVDGWLPSGGHRASWDPAAGKAPAGLYLAKLEFAGNSVVRKVLLVR